MKGLKIQGLGGGVYSSTGCSIVVVVSRRMPVACLAYLCSLPVLQAGISDPACPPYRTLPEHDMFTS